MLPAERSLPIGELEQPRPHDERACIRRKAGRAAAVQF